MNFEETMESIEKLKDLTITISNDDGSHSIIKVFSEITCDKLAGTLTFKYNDKLKTIIKDKFEN